MKRILTIDTNLGMEYARRFGMDGLVSFYAIINGEPYPKLESSISGMGFPEIMKVDDWADVIEGADAVFFSDVGNGGLADFLRKDGYSVFGSDRRTENLEIDRVYMRETFDRLGIAMASADITDSVDEVSEIVEANSISGKKSYVKLNKIRGSVETFGTDDGKEAEFILSQGNLAALEGNLTFVVEQELAGIEIGVDAWFNGKTFQPIVAETIELKGSGNLSKFINKNESKWYPEVLHKLEAYLRENGYHGLICFEGFLNTNGISVTDVTARPPYPCGYVYPSDAVGNLTELVMATAGGEELKMETAGRYSAQIGIYTDSKETWREIHVKNDRNVMFRRAIRRGGKYLFVPGDCLIATTIGAGDSMEAAFTDSKKRLDSVDAINSYNQYETLFASIGKSMKRLKEYDYDF